VWSLLAAIAGGGDADASVRLERKEPQEYSGSNPRQYVSSGMERFRRGDVKGSVRDFDKAMEVQPSYGDYLWQRGLSLYYADDFEGAAEQFLRDVKLNPRDTEESVWRIISQARMPGGSLAKAREDAIKTVGETRPYMKLIYQVFQGERDAQDLEAQIGEYSGQKGKAQDLFYLNLYAGLLAEADGRDADAKVRMRDAVASPYAQSGDYMYDLARVHMTVRGW